MKWLQFRRRIPGRPWWQTFLWWTIVRGIVFVYLKVVYRVRCEGHDRIPETGPIIYIANHQSHYDPMTIGVLVTDRPFGSMARESLFRFAPFGWMIRQLGAIPLDRSRGDAGAFKAVFAELNAGRCVLIFPEGTRTRDGRTAAFKRGVLLLLKRAEACVVPVAVEGAYDAWPANRSWPKLRGRLAVRCGDPIPHEELRGQDGAELLERLRRQIEVMRLELRATLRQSTSGRYPPPGPADHPYWEAGDSSA